jgi:hypothetical protein
MAVLGTRQKFFLLQQLSLLSKVGLPWGAMRLGGKMTHIRIPITCLIRRSIPLDTTLEGQDSLRSVHLLRGD